MSNSKNTSLGAEWYIREKCKSGKHKGMYRYKIIATATPVTAYALQCHQELLPDDAPIETLQKFFSPYSEPFKVIEILKKYGAKTYKEIKVKHDKPKQKTRP